LTNDWLKIKCLRNRAFIIRGWLPNESENRRGLLVGELFDDALRYLGTVQTGFTKSIFREILRKLIPQKQSPFADRISHTDARFCEPSMRVPIEFAEFTDDGHLRRPALSRFALDR